jgi:putative DNA primase/helicase
VIQENRATPKSNHFDYWRWLKPALQATALMVMGNHSAPRSGSLRDRPQPQANQIPEWLITQGMPAHATETRYYYSKTQWISRFDWIDPTHPKGRNKTLRQCHAKLNGKVKWSKGDSQWLPYRFDEALSVSPFANAQNAQKPLAPSPSFANAQGNQWLLVVEGEGCVETARSLGLAAITWQGSSWTEAEILPPLQRIKDSGFHGIVKFRDNDGEGEDKAKKLQLYGHKVGLNLIVFCEQLRTGNFGRSHAGSGIPILVTEGSAAALMFL